MEEKEYSLLKDVKLEINGTFSLCFWLYLPTSTQYPSLLLRQVFLLFLYTIATSMFFFPLGVFFYELYPFLVSYFYGVFLFKLISYFSIFSG